MKNKTMNKTINYKLNNLEKPFLIIGLGNPGEKYEKTRHNAGFLFLDLLAEQVGETWQENTKLKCQFIKTGNLILAKPTTYMNNSGQATQAIMSYYKMLPKKMLMTIKNSDLNDRLLVVHDELDIDFAKYKFSTNSRPAGNKGVASIINHLKTKNFTRLRLGIKSELLKHLAAKDFVLKRFSTEEQSQISELNKKILIDNFEI